MSLLEHRWHRESANPHRIGVETVFLNPQRIQILEGPIHSGFGESVWCGLDRIVWTGCAHSLQREYSHITSIDFHNTMPNAYESINYALQYVQVIVDQYSVSSPVQSSVCSFVFFSFFLPSLPFHPFSLIIPFVCKRKRPIVRLRQRKDEKEARYALSEAHKFSYMSSRQPRKASPLAKS